MRSFCFFEYFLPFFRLYSLLFNFSFRYLKKTFHLRSIPFVLIIAVLFSGELDASRNNLEVAKQILTLRVQQAQMHGYENYAQYALADTMAGHPSKVMELLEVNRIVFFSDCCSSFVVIWGCALN